MLRGQKLEAVEETISPQGPFSDFSGALSILKWSRDMSLFAVSRITYFMLVRSLNTQQVSYIDSSFINTVGPKAF